MFAEVLCGAVALLLYVNTLDADFCYDDRYLRGCVAVGGGSRTDFGGFVFFCRAAFRGISTPRGDRPQPPRGSHGVFQRGAQILPALLCQNSELRQTRARVSMSVKPTLDIK